MYFTIDRESKIILYGANNYSHFFQEKLHDSGYQVIAYLDRRAAEIDEMGGLTVYDLETQPFNPKNKKVVFIICFQNALQHEKVAKLLHDKGFGNILYLPMSNDGRNSEQQRRMRALYNDFTDGRFQKLKNIPCYDKMLAKSENSYSGIIRYNKESVVFWAPIELCYSSEEEYGNRSSDYTEQAKRLSRQYQGLNLCAQEPHVRLVSYFEGEGDCSLYMQIYGQVGHINKNFAPDEVFLKDRLELYQLYKSSLNEGMDFFIDSPMECIVNPERKIIVLDGIHRGVFLLKQGFKWIPAKVPKKDYEYLCNSTEAHALMIYFKSNAIKKTHMPIPHPSFYRFPAKAEVYGTTVLSSIQRVLGKLTTKNTYVLDMSGTCGYYARNFHRMGAAKVDCVIEPTDGITRLINKLFDMVNIDLISDPRIVLKRNYDIVVLHGDRLQDDVSLEKARSIIASTRRHVILQYNVTQDVEKLFKIKNYLKIAKSIVEGREYEVIIINTNSREVDCI